MPSTVTAKASIALPIETCWEKLRDLTRAVHYVPGLTECRITTEQKEGVGASRRVVSRQAGAMDETVTEWEEGEGFTIRLHKGTAPARPFREAHFRYQLVRAGEHCEIHTGMTYELAFGVLGVLLDTLIMRRMLGRSVQGVADGLAAYYERSEHQSAAGAGGDAE